MAAIDSSDGDITVNYITYSVVNLESMSYTNFRVAYLPPLKLTTWLKQVTLFTTTIETALVLK